MLNILYESHRLCSARARVVSNALCQSYLYFNYNTSERMCYPVVFGGCLQDIPKRDEHQAPTQTGCGRVCEIPMKAWRSLFARRPDGLYDISYQPLTGVPAREWASGR